MTGLPLAQTQIMKWGEQEWNREVILKFWWCQITHSFFSSSSLALAACCFWRLSVAAADPDPLLFSLPLPLEGSPCESEPMTGPKLSKAPDCSCYYISRIFVAGKIDSARPYPVTSGSKCLRSRVSRTVGINGAVILFWRSSSMSRSAKNGCIRTSSMSLFWPRRLRRSLQSI